MHISLKMTILICLLKIAHSLWNFTLSWLLAPFNNLLRYYFYIRLQAVAKLELSSSHTSWAVNQQLGSAFEPWRVESCQSGARAELSRAAATLGWTNQPRDASHGPNIVIPDIIKFKSVPEQGPLPQLCPLSTSFHEEPYKHGLYTF